MKLSVGKVKKKLDYPRNIYRFQLEAMQGDADGENYNNYDFNLTVDGDIPIEVEEVITMFRDFMNLDHNYQCHQLEDVRECLTKMYPKYNKKKIQELADAFTEMCGYDITCEGRIAHPRYMRFSYFDEKGDEYEVNVEGL